MGHGVVRMRYGVILAAIVAAGGARADPSGAWFGDDIALGWAGVFCAPRVVSVIAAPETETGTVSQTEMPQRKWSQHQVPAQIGLAFGVLATTHRDISGVVLRATHPGRAPEERWTRDYVAGELGGASFSFEYPEELRLGTWTFEGWDGDRLLFRASFEVVPPDSLPDILQECQAVS